MYQKRPERGRFLRMKGETAQNKEGQQAVAVRYNILAGG